MKRFIIGSVLVAALGLPTLAAEIKTADAPRQQTNVMSALIDRYMASTVLLYREDDNGTLKMVCTATAFEKVPGKNGEPTLYRFASAAHCVATDDAAHKEVTVEKSNFFVTLDEDDEKKFLPTRIVAAGYQDHGDDFAVLEVTTTIALPIMPFATQPPKTGEQIINIASPLGLGKQLFSGQVSMAHLARSVTTREINWKDTMLLQMSVGGGSSGSAIVSVQQEGIIAFLVGSINEGSSTNVVAIPVDKFRTFWEQAKDGKYKWFKPQE